MAAKVSDDKPAEWQQAFDMLGDVHWVFERLLAQARQAQSPSGPTVLQKRASSQSISPSAKKSRRA